MGYRKWKDQCTDLLDKQGKLCITQIGKDFYEEIREVFPMNEVPDSVVKALKEAQDALEAAETKIIHLLNKLTDESKRKNLW